MRRKPTKNTRGPNAAEKAYGRKVKERPCCVCGCPGPSIVQHCFGPTFKHNKVLIGHWFIIPLCPICDTYDTLGSHKAFREKFKPQSELWLEQVEKYGDTPPDDVVAAITDWGR